MQLKYPQGMTGPQPQGFAAMNMQAAPPAAQAQHHPPPAPPHQGPMGGMGGGGNMYGGPGGGGEPMPGHGPGPMPAQSAPQPKKAPIEFDQAINYVTKIKTRFAKQPETYKAFLEILHTYQKEQKTIKEVYEQVSTLFKNHTDLLAEFSQFLPDGSPEASGMLAQQPKTQKNKAIGLGGGMPPGLKQPVAQRPGAKGGPSRQQTDEDEERYWQKRKNNRKEDGKRPEGRPGRSPEAEFFSKCRDRMPKPLYLELLKCLNLYSQQALPPPPPTWPSSPTLSHEISAPPTVCYVADSRSVGALDARARSIQAFTDRALCRLPPSARLHIRRGSRRAFAPRLSRTSRRGRQLPRPGL